MIEVWRHRLPLALLAVVLVAGAVGLVLCRGGDAPPRTILLTGFGPFGPVEENPSWAAVLGLEGRRIGGAVVRTARLDVVYDRAARQLAAAIADTAPDTILCLGVAPGAELRVEVVARNRDRCPEPDNQGTVRIDQPIRAEGPAVLPTGLPVRRMVEALRAGGYEVRTSDDAGGYLCNHVFYRLMDELAGGRRAGFVHVPELEGVWDAPRLQAAVRQLVETLGAE